MVSENISLLDIYVQGKLLAEIFTWKSSFKQTCTLAKAHGQQKLAACSGTVCDYL